MSAVLKHLAEKFAEHISVVSEELAKRRRSESKDFMKPLTREELGFCEGVLTGYRRCLADDTKRVQLDLEMKELSGELANLRMLRAIVLESGILKYAPQRSGLTNNMKLTFAPSSVLEIAEKRP